MILAIRTDASEAYLALLTAGGKVLQDERWQADRQLAKGLLGKLEDLLKSQNANWDELSGLVVYRGPGSFTGLRIGITVMNTISYSENISIVGTSGERWLDEGVKLIEQGKNDQIVLPEYGADARITKPRK